MDYISLFGIAVGLSMDAFAVSITNGAVLKKVNLLTALRIAACFGIFQGAMPLIGWSIGKVGEQLIHTVDHWIALILLCYLGIKMIWDSRKKTKPLSAKKKHPKNKKHCLQWRWQPVLTHWQPALSCLQQSAQKP